MIPNGCETHAVIKVEDAIKYLPGAALSQMDSYLDLIAKRRGADGKIPVNHYYICNMDEPYAEIVHAVIMAGEKRKKLKNVSQSETSKESCDDSFAKDTNHFSEDEMDEMIMEIVSNLSHKTTRRGSGL